MGCCKYLLVAAQKGKPKEINDVDLIAITGGANGASNVNMKK